MVLVGQAFDDLVTFVVTRRRKCEEITNGDQTHPLRVSW